jgi:hypothetical protein
VHILYFVFFSLPPCTTRTDNIKRDIICAHNIIGTAERARTLLLYYTVQSYTCVCPRRT